MTFCHCRCFCSVWSGSTCSGSIKIVSEYERGVIFRLGRLLPQAKGPGIILVFRPFDRMQRVSLRTVTMDVPPPGCHHPRQCHRLGQRRRLFPRPRAAAGTWSRSRTTFTRHHSSRRRRCAQCSARPTSTTFSQEREKLNARLQEILDKHTDQWGIKVSLVEIKAVDLPPEMRRAMSRQAEAEREKRAKIIHAEGEYQAAEKLVSAANAIATEPVAIQLALPADPDRDRRRAEYDRRLSRSRSSFSTALRSRVSETRTG
jgi:regulator of protease activity HflC (stomatin/prohibitin superfamily)